MNIFGGISAVGSMSCTVMKTDGKMGTSYIAPVKKKVDSDKL